jgi:hypothetical protein
MKNDLDPLATDHQFFAALIQNDLPTLDQILADDFILIEVMGGSEVSKSGLLEALRSGQLKFQTIEPSDNRVRLYQTAAIVTGCTKMSGRFGETPFSTASRYTHCTSDSQTGGGWFPPKARRFRPDTKLISVALERPPFTIGLNCVTTGIANGFSAKLRRL